MQKSPDIFLHHILDEIVYLESIGHVSKGEALKSDATLARAVVRSLEVIGEAASKLDVTYRQLHPEIPWARIIAIRNRLIHDYMGINYNIVVNVLHNEIPALRVRIEHLLRSTNDSSGAQDSSIT